MDQGPWGMGTKVRSRESNGGGGGYSSGPDEYQMVAQNRVRIFLEGRAIRTFYRIGFEVRGKDTGWLHFLHGKIHHYS